MVNELQNAESREALEVEKLRLESEKLKVETGKLHRERAFIPLTFGAQLFNALCIIGTALSVLYFFQRPQLAQMDAARLSNERLQLENYVLAIQKFENDNDKVRAFQSLAEQWPQHPYLSELAKSEKAILEAKLTEADDCKKLAAQLVKLDESVKAFTSAQPAPLRRWLFSDAASMKVQEEAIKTEIAESLRKQSNCKKG